MFHMTVQVNARDQVLRKLWLFLLRTGYIAWELVCLCIFYILMAQVPQDGDADTLCRV